MTQAERVGKRVLQGLSKGRERAIAQAQARARQRAELIALAAQLDIATGKPAWGRAGRIARKLSPPLSVSQVRRYLARLFSVRDSLRQTRRDDMLSSQTQEARDAEATSVT